MSKKIVKRKINLKEKFLKNANNKSIVDIYFMNNTIEFVRENYNRLNLM